LTCRDVDEFLMRYLDGELPPDQRFTFECHLTLCADCRRYLDAYQRTVGLAAQACRESPADPYASAPPGLVVAIVHAVRGALASRA
jgi:anti-sigma factor RsiW